MTEAIKTVYCPALRMKQGELEGVRQLANDVADCIIPRFIVPPSSEREQEISLFEAFERTPDVSSFLAPVWARRPTLIDSTYILDEFDRSKSDSWMPRMFERARAKEVLAVPAALLSDVGSSANSFRSSIARDYQIKFGLIVPSDEMVRPELQTLIGVALASLDVLPQDCVVIADFGGADFSNPDIAAPIISAALEILQDVAPWRQIVFQGSNFPTNPSYS
jgi:Beta protein